MTNKQGGISCHLHSAKLSNVFEARSEVHCAILGRVISEDAPEYDELQLLGVLWVQHLLCPHVHEANIV